MALLGAEDRKRVEEVVAAAEARSNAEIVVAIVPRSADYARWIVGPAVIAAVIAALALQALFPVVGARWWLLAVLPLFALFWWVGNRRPIAVRLAPDAAEIAAVRAEALRLFADRTLFETRDRTGVLILVSELERRVEIVADRGIHARIGSAGWEPHVARIAEAIRRGQTLAGLEATVGAIADAAARPGDDAGNELPNLI